MLKYPQLFKMTWQEHFIYRLNFILWRLRNLIVFLSLIFFWLAVFESKTSFLGYQKSQMLAYLAGVAFLRSLVLGSRSIDLAGQIRSGELNHLLLKPMGVFVHWFTRDLADKLLNLAFTILEIGLIISFFKFPFYFPQKITSYFIFIFLVILAVFLYFFISFSLSMAAFWTQEVWATRWLFGIIFLQFLAGGFFPIDVLPKAFANLVSLTPFPYLIFFPLKIWLEQLPTGLIFRGVLVCLVWFFTFYRLAVYLWERGSKNYGAYGG